MTIRSFREGDEQLFFQLINEAYRNLEAVTLEYISRITTSEHFNPDGFFFAEKDGVPIGCIGVFNLPAKGFLWMGYLAVKDAFHNISIVNKLIEKALAFADHKKPKMIKAVTLMIQPYVDAYKQFGFKPIRRILRIAWDLTEIPENVSYNQKVDVVEVTEKDLEEASYVFVEGLKPYWDWWIEEEGGYERVLKRSKKWMKDLVCFVAKVNNEIVGLTGIVPNPKKDKADFLGVIVLPKFRMKGIGSALMKVVLNEARNLGYKRLVVHTVAYLDTFAPGAVLYLKWGGKIEMEYLHLVKEHI